MPFYLNTNISVFDATVYNTFRHDDSSMIRTFPPVMLNYAGEYCEYGEYCDACQAAVTVIRSCDAALKSCLEWKQ